MLNAYKVDVLRFLGQVSPNGSPALMLPLPPFISPSLFSPTASFYFPIILYIFKSHTDFFIPFQYPHSYCILALPPYPIFVFWMIYCHPPWLPVPSPNILHYYTWFLYAPHLLYGHA